MPEMSEEGEQVLKAKVSTRFVQAGQTSELQHLTMSVFMTLLPDPEVKPAGPAILCSWGCGPPSPVSVYIVPVLLQHRPHKA